MRLARLIDDDWELDDGDEYHRREPSTFELPPASERDSLQPGSLVKLMFRILVADDSGAEHEEVERMWVLVEERVGSLYRGKLDNQAICTPEIGPGFEVWFEPRHVIQIWRE